MSKCSIAATGLRVPHALRKVYGCGVTPLIFAARCVAAVRRLLSLLTLVFGALVAVCIVPLIEGYMEQEQGKYSEDSK